MYDTRANRIGEQNTAYRRGLVMGLTMAEVGILIIFVLLLLLLFGEVQRARVMVGKRTIPEEQLRELEEDHAALADLKEEFPDTPVEEIIRLVRMAKKASATSDGQDLAGDIRRARDEIVKILGPDGKQSAADIAKRIEQQTFLVANQEGQLRHYEQKLAMAGQGKGERPCWVQPDGTIDYLYDIVLTSDGIRMRECDNPNRAAERVQLPAPAVDPREVIAEAAFLARTRPLFDYSQRNNCRFFVVVYDATASEEKPLYKSLLRTVEGHFYKRLADGAAPF